MSNFIHYFDSENKLVGNKYDAVRDDVLRLLTIIDGQGHSGASMGFFSAMVTSFIEDPSQDFESCDMFGSFFTQAKRLDPAQLRSVVQITRKIMTYTPLSPLQGGPDEWMLVTGASDLPAMEQNRRLGYVFREDGKAYNSNGRVFYEPSEDHSTFLGYTGSGSRVPISFPYDPETPREAIFYSTQRRDSVLYEGHEREGHNQTEPWLRRQRITYLAGFIPGKQDKLLDRLLDVTDPEHLQTLIPHFNNVLKPLLDAPGADLVALTEAYRGPWEYKDTDMYFSISQNVNLARVSSQYLADPGNRQIAIKPIYVPTENFQHWKPSGLYILDATPVDRVFVSQRHLVAVTFKQARKYLFDQCKILGTEFKAGKTKEIFIQ